MAPTLYVVTSIGIFMAAQGSGGWAVVGRGLENRPLTSIAVSAGAVLAGSAEGIWRSVDGGKTWQEASEGLGVRYVRWMAATSKPTAVVLAGTEPAGIFVSQDAGGTWRPAPEVFALRDANGWSLPYSPRAGCVRGFAFAEPGPREHRVYAAVEVGGVLVSQDGGKSWGLAAGSDGKPDMNRELGTMIHPDVHSISVHPSSADIVTAATGGGLYRSADGGRSWENIYPSYIRAAWVDPADPRHIVAGPADGVARNGRIEESADAGRTWRPAAGGMAVPWARHMVERFASVDAELFAVLSNGELWSRKPGGSTWGRVLPELSQVKAVAAGN